MYTHPQDVFYYPEGPRIEYASPEEAVTAYVEAHFPGASQLQQCDEVASTGYPHAVAFVAVTGVKHGVYLKRAGDKWIVAATSEVVPPERLTPNYVAEAVVLRVSAASVDCPHCGAPKESWVADPRDKVHQCDDCCKSYRVPSDVCISF